MGTVHLHLTRILFLLKFNITIFLFYYVSCYNVSDKDIIIDSRDAILIRSISSIEYKN